MRGYQDQCGVCSKICEVAITRNSATSGKILLMDDKKTQLAGKNLLPFVLLIQTQVEPVIQAGNEGVVHHMLLYECNDTFPDHHLNYTGHCYARNMPPAVADCRGGSAMFAWAIGGKVGNVQFCLDIIEGK